MSGDLTAMSAAEAGIVVPIGAAIAAMVAKVLIMSAPLKCKIAQLRQTGDLGLPKIGMGKTAGDKGQKIALQWRAAPPAPRFARTRWLQLRLPVASSADSYRSAQFSPTRTRLNAGCVVTFKKLGPTPPIVVTACAGKLALPKSTYKYSALKLKSR